MSMKQAFLLADGSRFKWQNEEYKLISQTDSYVGEVEDSRGQRHNFNTCATVEVIEDAGDDPIAERSSN